MLVGTTTEWAGMSVDVSGPVPEPLAGLAPRPLGGPLGGPLVGPVGSVMGGVGADLPICGR